MTKSLVKFAAAFALIGGFGATAEASSIKDAVPTEALSAYCAKHGVGSNTRASLLLGDGSTLTGSIECEAEDLAVNARRHVPELPEQAMGANSAQLGHSSDGESGAGGGTGSGDAAGAGGGAGAGDAAGTGGGGSSGTSY